jgi:hypothetical protein
MGQERSTTSVDLGSLINDELSRIKALAISIIGVAHAGDELEDLPYNVHPLDHVQQLATLILEQENKIRKDLEVHPLVRPRTSLKAI